MSYTLIAIFLISGDVYVEDQKLSLQGCAGRAAIARQQYMEVLPKLNKKIGPVQWRCIQKGYKADPKNTLSK